MTDKHVSYKGHVGQLFLHGREIRCFVVSEASLITKCFNLSFDYKYLNIAVSWF